jgi:Protein of unknown function (DUF2478)
LIINEFGKHEAEGRGFRAVIAKALSEDSPVLVGVNALNLLALEAFENGLGHGLPCESTARKALPVDADNGDPPRGGDAKRFVTMKPKGEPLRSRPCHNARQPAGVYQIGEV